MGMYPHRTRREVKIHCVRKVGISFSEDLEHGLSRSGAHQWMRMVAPCHALFLRGGALEMLHETAFEDCRADRGRDSHERTV